MKKLFVFIGTTGVGKTYYSKKLVEKYGLARVFAITTRPVRPTHPDEYIHVTKSEFEDMVSNGEMLEYTVFNSNYYGRRRSDLLDTLEGSHAIIDMTTDRIAELKEHIPEAVVIHLSLPDPIVANTRTRIAERNWNEAQIAERLVVVQKELLEIERAYAQNIIDHSITTIEGEPETTAQMIETIVAEYLSKEE